MALLDFNCYIDGDIFKPCKVIKIPDVCCGSIILIHRSATSFMPDSFRVGCIKHMDSYKNIWNNFAHLNAPELEKIKPPMENSISGHKCSGCFTYNEYAEVNQPDGTFKCYSCRNRW